MELFSLQDTAEMLGVTTRTVKNMVRRGQLVAVYPKTGKNGRPNLMITASSYGDYILSKGENYHGKNGKTK